MTKQLGLFDPPAKRDILEGINPRTFPTFGEALTEFGRRLCLRAEGKPW